MNCKALLLMAAWIGLSDALTTLRFGDLGGIPLYASAAAHNTKVLNRLFRDRKSDFLLLFEADQVYHFHHGVYGQHLSHVVVQIDGTLRFERSDEVVDHNLTKYDPFPSCFMLDQSSNITLTSSQKGILDGRGPQWWGIPLYGYLETAEHRPRLLRFNETSDLLIENIILQDSPFHSLYLETVRNVEIRHMSIVARRTSRDGHGMLDLSAFNTDGIDVSGRNIWMHDIDIWVQDDCIAVKDALDYQSNDMVFERINASGLGLTIGSILTSEVRNITFRDSYLHRTMKGIYMKFATPDRVALERADRRTAVIEDVVYENITMEEPLQWPIWMGPAQQADTTNICHPNPCSLCWPTSPSAKCHAVASSKFRNITLRNIRINNPRMATGVILADPRNEIEGLLLDNVVVMQGEPVAAAQKDRTVSFPGLLQPINDPYVPDSFSHEKNVVDYVDPSDWLKSLHLDYEAETWLGMVESWAVWIDDMSSFLLWALVTGCIIVMSLLVRSLRLRFARATTHHRGVIGAWEESMLVLENTNSALEDPLLSVQEPKASRSRAATEDTALMVPNDMDEDEDDVTTNPADDLLLIPLAESLSTIEEASESDSSPERIPLNQRPLFLTALLVFLTVVTCALTTDAVEHRWPWNKHKWERTNRYYVCKGVSNGVARGDTWPIPSCVKRESARRKAWKW